MKAIRLVVVLAMAAAFAGSSAPPATAAYEYYYSGTLTENHHNFGRCYYSIGSECTGFRIYLFWNDAFPAASDGDTYLAIDNNVSIRGIFIFPAGLNWRFWTSETGWSSNNYLRGSVTIWTSSYTSFDYARICAEVMGTCATS